MANNDSSTKKSMDVAKPGLTAADASARPVIVTHRPMVQDPMMKQDDNVSDMEPSLETPSSKTNKSPNSGEKTIKPLNDMVTADPSEIDKAAAAAASGKKKNDAPEDAGATKESTEAEDDSLKDEIDNTNDEDQQATNEKTTIEDKQSAETEKPDKTDNKPAKKTDDSEAVSNDAAVVNAVIDQADDKHKQNDDAKQDKSKQEHIQKLIDDKKYFVKTGQVARRRKNRIAVACLILILVAAGLYLAIDAKLISTGFDVPVQIIKN